MKQIGQEISLLELLAKTRKNKVRKDIVKNASNQTICSICEIAKNVLVGNVPLTKNQRQHLLKHKTTLRQLGDKRYIKSVKKRRHVLVQKGGALLPLLLAPFLTYAADAIARKVFQKANAP